MTLENVLEILPAGTPGYFATTNGDQLELRGWQYQFTEDNKFFFVTANTKDVYKQMLANPQVAFAGTANEYNFRISGKAVFVTDSAKIEKYFTKLSEGVQGMYKDAKNPVLAIFYLESGEVKVSKGYAPFETVKF